MVIPDHSHERRLHRVALVLVLAIALSVTACAMFKKLDVGQIHREAAACSQRNPIIFIHGFIGSKLRNRNTHETVWGRFWDAIKRGRSDDLGLPIDSQNLYENRDDLVPYAIYESVAGVDFYGALLDALRDAGGYRLGDINNPEPGGTCYIYTYDWRRDNVESAIGLGRVIKRIKTRLHAPDMKFDIVAHSMGGLVAEYYLKYGAEDVISDWRARPVTYAGAPDIGRLILIGAPLRGTMQAFQVLNTGFSRTMSPEVVSTMPSIYQLLPSEGRGRIIDPHGNPVRVDLYDADDWVRNGWSVFRDPSTDDDRRRSGVNRPQPAAASDSGSRERRRVFLQTVLDRARRFHDALERDSSGGSPVPVHLFGSDCIPTLDRAVLKQTPSGPVTLFDDESSPDRAAKELTKIMLAPGDGTVTTASLLALEEDDDLAIGTRRSSMKFASTHFFCETHGLLPKNRGFQNNLFHVLFHSPMRAEAAAGAHSSR